MTIIASPLATSQASIPIVSPSQVGKFAGLHMHFPTSAAFQAAVAAEQANVTAGSAVWADGQPMTVSGEPNGVRRLWYVSLNHARTVSIKSGLSAVLSADTNVVTGTSGLPGTGVGSTGDLNVDYNGNVVYLKGSSAWSISVAAINAASGSSTIAGASDFQTARLPQQIGAAIAFNATTGVATKPDATTFTPASGVAPPAGYNNLTVTVAGTLPTPIDSITALALNDSLNYMAALGVWTISKATLALLDLSDGAARAAAITAASTAAAAAIPATQKGVANGVMPLDSNGKALVANLPATILGALNYQGTYNASTSTPAIVAGNKGFYWKTSVAGTSLGYTLNVGDLVVDNGTTIDKIDGISSEVVSVAGRTGPVVLATADLSDLASVITTPLAAAAALAAGAIPATQKGAALGVAPLDAGGKVPAANLPVIGPFTTTASLTQALAAANPGVLVQVGTVPYTTWRSNGREFRQVFGTLRQVSNRCISPDTLNAAVTYLKQAEDHIALDDLYAPVIVIGNYYCTSAGGEVDPGQDAILLSSSIQYNGVTTRLTVGGVNTGITIPKKGLLTFDPAPLPTMIPKGSRFTVYRYVNAPAGICCSNVTDALAGEMKITSGTAALSDDVANPAGMTSAFYTQKWPTLAIADFSTMPAWFGCWDSRSVVGNSVDGTNFRGMMDIPFANVAIIKSGVSGEVLGNVVNTAGFYTNRVALSAYCTHICGELMINDIAQGISAAVVVTRIKSLVTMFGNKPMWYTTAMPSTTSTDYFTSDAGQTSFAQEAVRISVNTSIRNMAVGNSGYWDCTDAVEGLDGKWKLPERSVVDAGITSGAQAFTSATARFGRRDMGKSIMITGAGASGANLSGAIIAVTNSTTVNVFPAASTTVSGATAYIGILTADGLHGNWSASLMVDAARVIRVSEIK